MAKASWNYVNLARCKNASAEGKEAIYIEGKNDEHGFALDIDEVDSFIEELQELREAWYSYNKKESEVS
jgi:hypothetical protein